MKNNPLNPLTSSLREIISAIVLVVLLLLILNPFDLWMPTMAHMIVLAATFIVFVFFTAFIFREGIYDEREDTHRMLAGRYAFFAGTLTLVIGVVFQEYSGHVDPWLILGLVVMILTKIGARLWSDYQL